MQLISRRFNNIQMNYSTHVQMLMVQEMQKNSLTHSNINVRLCNFLDIHLKKLWWMQNATHEYLTFKMNDSIHVQMLMVQEMQKKSLTHSNINVNR
jgi:hypothetical protein